MEYTGEHLLPGNIGHLLVIISFTAALLAAFSFFFSTNSNELIKKNSWKNIGRFAFGFHSIAVIGVIGVLFYLISNHYYEYHYVWEHSSNDLPTRYLFSCFWEGQEGSFLLWSMWHVILGVIVLFTAGKWEAPVMAVIAVIQVFLASMLLGIFFLGAKIGSSPFVLLRDVMTDAPIFQQPNYLEFITDGNGLNPLLQNYWMTIHPPTLFLGFAAAAIPFAYGVAALWTRQYKEWVKPVLSWSLFATMVLGLGIMMGAAWAYESLTFGGYWAWDPVENASLVPWLTLIAGVHTLIAFKNSGHALKASFILIMVSFLLVLYATFLTRSGILGESSVHAFTDLGMSGQLLIYLFFFILLSAVLLFINWRFIPEPKKEEKTYSREFWIFIGSLVFVLSCIHVVFVTSIPVFNKVFDTNIAPPTDVIAFYNKWQMPIAMIIAVLTASIQYLRYKDSDINRTLKKLAVPVVISIVIAAAVGFYIELHWFYSIFMATALFAVTANMKYIFSVLSGKIKIAGGSVAHIGFGLMLIGILISSADKEVISINTMGIDYGEGFDEQNKRENILLYKDMPARMGDYVVTYVGDSVSKPNHYYKVKYNRLDRETGEVVEQFMLYPNAQINPKMGLVANPDTRHYIEKDVFTHVSSVPDKSKKPKPGEYKSHTLAVGDTIYTSRTFIVLEQLNTTPTHPEYTTQEGDLAVGARLQINTMDSFYYAEPLYLIRDNREVILEEKIEDIALRTRFTKIDPSSGEMQIEVAEDKPAPDYIIMKAIIFPGINILWTGIIFMVLGFLISMIRRVKEKHPNRDHSDKNKRRQELNFPANGRHFKNTSPSEKEINV